MMDRRIKLIIKIKVIFIIFIHKGVKTKGEVIKEGGLVFLVGWLLKMKT